MTEQVVAFQRKAIRDGSTIDLEPLDLPPTQFDTEAIWFLPEPEQLHGSEQMPRLLGTLHAAEHALIALLPLWAMCDRWDIGGLSTNVHFQTGRPTIFVYDGHAGGVGITERGYDVFGDWVADTARMIRGCPCEHGCPSCVQSPKCGNLNEPLDKTGALALLDAMLREAWCRALFQLRRVDRAQAPIRCAACCTPHWLTAKPAAGALVVADGRSPLTRRAIEPWLGCWCAPSGFCDGDEHLAVCAEREALEEAGIRVRIVGYPATGSTSTRRAGQNGVDPEYCAVSYYHAVPIGEAGVVVDPRRRPRRPVRAGRAPRAAFRPATDRSRRLAERSCRPPRDTACRFGPSRSSWSRPTRGG